MKNSLRKLFTACAAVSAITVCATASAMAADLGTVNYQDTDNSAVIVQVPTADAGTQSTVLVLNNGADDTNVQDADILYIDQEEGTNGFTTLKLKGTDKLANGTYKVKVGATVGGTFTIYEGSFTIGDPAPKVKYGDVTEDGYIFANDAATVLQHTSKVITLTDSQKLAADVTGDGYIFANDAATILQYTSKVITTFPVESK